MNALALLSLAWTIAVWAAPPTASPAAVIASVEDLLSHPELRKAPIVIIRQPQLGGKAFLAATPHEARRGDVLLQRQRARNLCRLVGYSEPATPAISPFCNSSELLEADERGGTSSRRGTYFGEYCAAIFSEITCLK